MLPFLASLVAPKCSALNLVTCITHWISCMIQNVGLGKVKVIMGCSLGYIMKQLWRYLSVEGKHLVMRDKQMRPLKQEQR